MSASSAVFEVAYATFNAPEILIQRQFGSFKEARDEWERIKKKDTTYRRGLFSIVDLDNPAWGVPVEMFDNTGETKLHHAFE